MVDFGFSLSYLLTSLNAVGSLLSALHSLFSEALSGPVMSILPDHGPDQRYASWVRFRSLEHALMGWENFSATSSNALAIFR